MLEHTGPFLIIYQTLWEVTTKRFWKYWRKQEQTDWVFKRSSIMCIIPPTPSSRPSVLRMYTAMCDSSFSVTQRTKTRWWKAQVCVVFTVSTKNPPTRSNSCWCSAMRYRRRRRRNRSLTSLCRYSNYLIKSTLRLRKASSAAPFSIPFCRSARSISWCTMALSLA